MAVYRMQTAYQRGSILCFQARCYRGGKLIAEAKDALTEADAIRRCRQEVSAKLRRFRGA